jgi:hypothetical protein
LFRQPTGPPVGASVPDGDTMPANELRRVRKRSCGARHDPMGTPRCGGRIKNIVERGGGRPVEIGKLDSVSAQQLDPFECAARRLLAVTEPLSAVHRAERHLRVDFVESWVHARQRRNVDDARPERVRLCGHPEAIGRLGAPCLRRGRR